MDISKETSVEKLQAMAYQQVKLLNQAQGNLQIIENRISEIEQEELAKPKK